MSTPDVWALFQSLEEIRGLRDEAIALAQAAIREGKALEARNLDLQERLNASELECRNWRAAERKERKYRRSELQDSLARAEQVLREISLLTEVNGPALAARYFKDER